MGAKMKKRELRFELVQGEELTPEQLDLVARTIAKMVVRRLEEEHSSGDQGVDSAKEGRCEDR